jgi:hypothetical protein
MGTRAMPRSLMAGALGLVLAWSGESRAQLVETSVEPVGTANWTATAARTVGTGNTVLQVEAGWPGIGFTFLKGLDERSDIGFHVAFNYGFEGTTNSVSGVNLAVPYRRTLTSSGDTALAFHMEPGLTLYGHDGLLVGIGGPIGVIAGFHVSNPLTLDVAADFPVLISFSNPTGVMFGPQFGAGVEYLIDRNLAVTARFRIGPQFAFASGDNKTQAAFTTLIGLAYNAR